MAVYHPVTVTCSCGNTFTANLARSINAGRTPAIREKIIHGDFHQVNCSRCAVVSRVGKSKTASLAPRKRSSSGKNNV